MTGAVDPFDELQMRLGPALDVNRPGSGIDHVLVVLPSCYWGVSSLAAKRSAGPTDQLVSAARDARERAMLTPADLEELRRRAPFEGASR